QPSDRVLNVSIRTSSCAWQSARIRLWAIPSSPDGTGDKTRNVRVAGCDRPVTFTRLPDLTSNAGGQDASDWFASKCTLAVLPSESVKTRSTGAAASGR